MSKRMHQRYCGSCKQRRVGEFNKSGLCGLCFGSRFRAGIGNILKGGKK